MFDIGFPELLLISVVALLVIGPDKLPETIRAMSLWIGRFRRSFANIKQEIEKEIGADEIRSQLYNEAIMQDIEKTKNTLKETRDEVNHAINQFDSSVNSLNPDDYLNKPADEPRDQTIESPADGDAPRNAAQENENMTAQTLIVPEAKNKQHDGTK